MLSALPLRATAERTSWIGGFVSEADSCTATNDVHGLAYSITSSARASTLSGMSNPHPDAQFSFKLALSISLTACNDALCASSWYATVTPPRSTHGSLWVKRCLVGY